MIMTELLPFTPNWPLSKPVTTQGRALLELVSDQLQDIGSSAADNDREGAFPYQTFDRFRESGVMGATVPAELGGLGVSCLHDLAVVLQAIATADASTALALHMQFSRGMTLTYEWEHSSRRVRILAERLLQEMATGRAAVCGAVKDHPAAVTKLTPDGAGNWILSGRKTLVSMCPIGTHFVVHTWTQYDGQQPRLAAAIVPRDTRGLTILDTWQGLGMRASGTLDVAFKECPVADNDVILRDTLGAHNDAVLAGQTVSSIAMLGIYTGLTQAARDIALGTLVGQGSPPFPAVKTLIAETESGLYALRAATAAALSNADELAQESSMDPAERGRQMMIPYQQAKLAINRMAPAIVDACITITGSAAYAESHELARILRDVRAGNFMQPYTYPGGVDFISAQVLGLDRDNDYMSVRASKSSQSVR
jgi:alkylation response protein AidB-like acyl-CoA dehydrogenase